MSIDIEELHNIHSDKVCHVIGMGPSLEEHINILENIDKSKNIIICVNDFDLYTKLIPDYWLTINPCYCIGDVTVIPSSQVITNFYKRINKFPDVIYLYGDNYDHTPVDKINELLNVKFYSFDNMHFNSEPNIFWGGGQRLGCDRGWVNCCKNLIPGRLTIQEYLQKITGYDKHFGTGDTCIVFALAFAIIFGCKNINLYGIDLDYTMGYYGGAKFDDSLDRWMPRIKSDFYILCESAKAIGCRIKYFGYNDDLYRIINNYEIPERVFESNCKNYN